MAIRNPGRAEAEWMMGREKILGYRVTLYHCLIYSAEMVQSDLG